ncbi:MAG: 2-oxoglutarate dehydrogenase E1 component, partial [Rhodocyclaceae bacterium]
STLEDLAEGTFQTVIGEMEELGKKVARVIVCSGKIYFELLAARREHKIADTAILRLEQLYPFPEEVFAAQMAKFSTAKEVVWCQEEPQNQGAWYSTRHHLVEHLKKGQTLRFVGRPASASPAVGYYSKHVAQQKAIIESAFGLSDD